MSSKPSDPAFLARYGPWAVVAGASEGLGEAFARHAAARGLSVVLVARRAGALADAASAIEARYAVTTRTVVADLADASGAEMIIAAVADLDVGLVVHNAALSVPGAFLDVPLPVHLAAIAVNCASQVALLHGLGRRLRECGRGGLIVVSSLSGLYGTGYLATYAATKAFGLTLAEGLWSELAPAVDVVATCAGATLTPGYAARAPRRLPRLAPAPMAPDTVADDALRALGRGPRTIPGAGNRLASFLLRTLPRRRAIALMTDAGRAVLEAHHDGRVEDP
ncbi:MAG: short-chain dehydrogenase [Myxococcales bacterium]